MPHFIGLAHRTTSALGLVNFHQVSCQLMVEHQRVELCEPKQPGYSRSRLRSGLVLRSTRKLIGRRLSVLHQKNNAARRNAAELIFPKPSWWLSCLSNDVTPFSHRTGSWLSHRRGSVLQRFPATVQDRDTSHIGHVGTP